jgi:hypothetical protein
MREVIEIQLNLTAEGDLRYEERYVKLENCFLILRYQLSLTLPAMLQGLFINDRLWTDSRVFDDD